MFGLAAPKAKLAGIETQNYLENVVNVLTDVDGNGGKQHLSELTFDEANRVIVWLGGEAFRAYGNSKRNENHKKQEAGIKTVETEIHVTAIREAAALRNMGEDGLTSLATRMNLPWPPHTTEQGNKVFEAVKAMNKRDNIVAFPKAGGRNPHGSKGASSSSQPSFRRVA